MPIFTFSLLFIIFCLESHGPIQSCLLAAKIIPSVAQYIVSTTVSESDLLETYSSDRLTDHAVTYKSSWTGRRGLVQWQCHGKSDTTALCCTDQIPHSLRQHKYPQTSTQMQNTTTPCSAKVHSLTEMILNNEQNFNHQISNWSQSLRKHYEVQLTPLICTALGPQVDLHVSGACI